MSDNSQLLPVRDPVSSESGYAGPMLIAESSISRLYKVTKAGKYFILKTACDDSGRMRAMIRREYDISIGLDHPHLANVFTFEENTVVGSCIVMEYVDGRNLTEFLLENPSMSSRRRVVGQLLDAVSYLHRKGVIHNDLKPENVLISHSDNSVKLIDFGLSDTDAYYLARAMGCTAEYASPELLRQEGVDSRSDIYSLGLLLKDILGTRYSYIVKRCTEQNRDGRYADVDQLMKAISHRYRPVYAALAVACLVVMTWVGGNVADEILQFREFKTAEKERQELCDSVCAAIDSQVVQLYADLENKLKSVPYIEFGFLELGKTMGLLPSIRESFQNIISDPGTIAMVASHYDLVSQRQYEKILNIIHAMPSISDVSLSDDEYLFYLQLIGNSESYRPFK